MVKALLLFFFLNIFFITFCVCQTTGEISDCSDCKPKTDTTIDNSLTINTRENTYAVVKIVESGSGKCIRYIFLNKGDSYVIKNIPKGNYNVKFALGSEWEAKKNSKCKLRFKDKKPLFMKTAKPLQFKKVLKGGTYEISSFTLNLGISFSESNIANTKISDEEFEN